jgi:hypothetical protein
MILVFQMPPTQPPASTMHPFPLDIDTDSLPLFTDSIDHNYGDKHDIQVDTDPGLLFTLDESLQSPLLATSPSDSRSTDSHFGYEKRTEPVSPTNSTSASLPVSSSELDRLASLASTQEDHVSLRLSKHNKRNFRSNPQGSAVVESILTYIQASGNLKLAFTQPSSKVLRMEKSAIVTHLVSYSRCSNTLA